MKFSFSAKKSIFVFFQYVEILFDSCVQIDVGTTCADTKEIIFPYP